MNVPTITIDRTEAKKAYTEYREEVRRRHDDELAAIARGYRHAGKGRALLRVGQAISEAGVDGQGLPRLAIARAHAHWCHVSVSSDGRVAFGEEAAPSWRARVSVRRFPADTLPAAVGAVFWRDWPKRAMAMVPIVPPALRPRHHLRNYHVLWEAEWRRQPPEDPMLLKSLGGDLYAVLATWDLTELEQAVLAGRQVE